MVVDGKSVRLPSLARAEPTLAFIYLPFLRTHRRRRHLSPTTPSTCLRIPMQLTSFHQCTHVWPLPFSGPDRLHRATLR